MTRILVLEIKDRYKLELQSPETMTLFGSTKKLADRTKNGVAEVILVRYNLVDNQYQNSLTCYILLHLINLMLNC